MRAAHAALDDGKTKYTEMVGTRELRDAICADLKRRKGLEYTPEQIVCSSGAKQSIVQAMLALVGPRDEVLIPAPYWVSYPQMAILCGATPTVIPTTAEDGYLLQPAWLLDSSKRLDTEGWLSKTSKKCETSKHLKHLRNLRNLRNIRHLRNLKKLRIFKTPKNLRNLRNLKILQILKT